MPHSRTPSPPLPPEPQLGAFNHRPGFELRVLPRTTTMDVVEAELSNVLVSSGGGGVGSVLESLLIKCSRTSPVSTGLLSKMSGFTDTAPGDSSSTSPMVMLWITSCMQPNHRGIPHACVPTLASSSRSYVCPPLVQGSFGCGEYPDTCLVSQNS
jgi:hypothetical protein